MGIFTLFLKIKYMWLSDPTGDVGAGENERTKVAEEAAVGVSR